MTNKSVQVTVIRLMTLLLLIAIPLITSAGCGGGLTGKAGDYEYYIGTGDCQYEQDMVMVSHQNDSMGTSHEFAPACTFSFESGNFMATGFSCAPDSKSPLAGSKYLLKEDPARNGACEKPPYHYYQCVTGCSEKIPAHFDIIPVECDDEG